MSHVPICLEAATNCSHLSNCIWVGASLKHINLLTYIRELSVEYDSMNSTLTAEVAVPTNTTPLLFLFVSCLWPLDNLWVQRGPLRWIKRRGMGQPGGLAMDPFFAQCMPSFSTSIPCFLVVGPQPETCPLSPKLWQWAHSLLNACPHFQSAFHAFRCMTSASAFPYTQTFFCDLFSEATTPSWVAPCAFCRYSLASGWLMFSKGRAAMS